MATGAIAFAATTGAVIGLGLRAGGATRAWQLLGVSTIGNHAAALFTPEGLTALGVLLHALLAAGAGMLTAWLTSRRGSGPWRWAVAISVGLLALSLVIAFPRDELFAPFPLRNRVVLTLVLTAALGLGMRLALEGDQRS